jgi:hypothetical protein
MLVRMPRIKGQFPGMVERGMGDAYVTTKTFACSGYDDDFSSLTIFCSRRINSWIFILISGFGEGYLSDYVVGRW